MTKNENPTFLQNVRDIPKRLYFGLVENIHVSSPRNAWEKISSSWSELIKLVQGLAPHVDLLVKKSQVVEPWLFGFRKSSVGWKKGALRHWRLALSNGRSIHIREYADHFKIHWDFADPRKNPFKHLVYDTRRLYNAIRVLVACATSAAFLYHPEFLQALIGLIEKGVLIP